MVRALSTLGLVVILALGGIAHAGNKKTIAVLGLEISAGTVDQTTSEAAKEMTKKLREKVASDTTSFTLAGGPQKELIDIKLGYNCGNEEPPCMAKFANDVGAAYLLFGHIEKVGSNYNVSLKLMDASNPQATPKNYTDQISVASMSKGNDAASFAVKLFNGVAGDNKLQVTLHISGSSTGTVTVDNKVDGHYTSNTYKLNNQLDEGKHHVVIEPDEKNVTRFDNSLQVDADHSTVEIKILLLTACCPPNPPGDDSNKTGGGIDKTHEYTGTVSNGGGGRTGLKVGAWSSAVLSAGGFAVWIYGYSQIKKYDDKMVNIVGSNGQAAAPPGGGLWDSSKCSSASTLPSNMGDNNKFKDACTGHTLTVVGPSAGFDLAVVSGILFYFAYRGDHAEQAPPSTSTTGSRKHRDKPTIAIVPAVGPNGAGATFRLDW